MKSFILIVMWLIIHSSPTSLNAQNFYNTWYYNYDLVWEAGVGSGIMNCLTDIGGRKGRGAKFLKDIRWSSSRPCINLYIAVTYKDVITLRLNWQSGSVNAADSQLRQSDPDPAGRYGRNLSFRSRIKEVSLMIETHPLFWRLGPQDKIPAFSPYLTAGIGYYHFNPQASLGGQWYDLQPLRLEGQGFPSLPSQKPYKLKQFSIPAGIGVRYETGPLLNIRFDCVYRFLFTDYLDDVSGSYIDPIHFDQYFDPQNAAIAKRLYQRMGEIRPGANPVAGSQRGNPENRDAYFSFQLSFSYVFRHSVR